MMLTVTCYKELKEVFLMNALQLLFAKEQLRWQPITPGQFKEDIR